MAKKIIILGKPNVGKSSLFNRLLKDKIAITSDLEGTTRDINIRPLNLGEAENPLYVELCDTAGLMKKANGIFKNVKKMIFDFINEGDLILYVISADGGIIDDDLRFFRSLKNATLIVNKTDIEKNERWEYSAFGAKDIFYVSSLHNRGIKQLKDFLANSACGDFSRSASAHSLQRTPSASHSFASHNHENSLTILEFADSNADSTESSLRGESIDSPKQSTKNNLHEVQTESRPIRGAKNRNQTSSSASADFLLESDKRGSPPKSEKRQLLARRGSGAGGAALLRKEKGESNIECDDSSVDCHDSAFAESRNDNIINIGIIGRVNVGKSSILNALLNKERSLVSEIEGTTIDPVSDEIVYKDKILRFVDTAGIRRASKIEGIEKFALQRTKRILEQSNIVLLVLDSSSDFVELDEKISGLSQKYNLGIIILLNKWDIKCADFRAFSESIKRKFAYLSYAPILTISALKMRHIDDIKATILRVWENFNRRIPTALLNSHIKIATQRHPIPSERGKIVKIYYASQVDCAPPQIILVMNRPRALHFSYKRYLVNYFRTNFDFSGVPIVILTKGRDKDEIAE